jgi:hypothetical protein
LIAALADLFTTGTPSDCMEFTMGALEIMRTIMGGLIARGVVEPTAFQPELAQRAAVWRAKGFRHRTLAIESMLDSLRTFEAAVVENNGKVRKPN